MKLLELSCWCVIAFSMLAFLFSFSRSETGQKFSTTMLIFATLWFTPLLFMFLFGGIR